MNHKGALSKQIIMSDVVEMCMADKLEYNEPVLITFEDPNIPGVPIAPVWLSIDEFKDPGEINFG